jgi:hypothetical protein
VLLQLLQHWFVEVELSDERRFGSNDGRHRSFRCGRNRGYVLRRCTFGIGGDQKYGPASTPPALNETFVVKLLQDSPVLLFVPAKGLAKLSIRSPSTH